MAQQFRPVIYREQEQEERLKQFKAIVPIKVCNQFKYVTIQKVLYDETQCSKFMCFGGGTTNVEAEYVRDTFCVNNFKMSQTVADYKRVNNVKEDKDKKFTTGYVNDELNNDSPENIIEVRY